MRNCFEISYGSLKEAKYLVEFSYKRKLINNKEYTELFNLADEIGKMLWTVIKKI